MTAYYKLDHSEPGYLSQMLPRADGSWVKRADYEADLAAARAENERLTKARDNLSRLEQSHREQANEQFHRAEKDEAENQRLREVLMECEAEIDRYIWQEYPLDHPVHVRSRQRAFIANPARVALSRTYTF